MREKDEMKMTVRHYRFVLLRIKFPDGIILQGVWQLMCSVFKLSKQLNGQLILTRQFPCYALLFLVLMSHLVPCVVLFHV